MDNILEVFQFPKEYRSYWPWYLSGFDDMENPGKYSDTIVFMAVHMEFLFL